MEYQLWLDVKCWMSREETGELISGYSSMLHEYCANSGSGRFGVTDVTQIDGLGFSLCAAPLNIVGSCISKCMESCAKQVEEQRSRVFQTRVGFGSEELVSKRVKLS